MGRRKKERGPCPVCEGRKTGRVRAKTCSRSCGAVLRWERAQESGKVVDFVKAGEAARRTAYAKRLQAEYLALVKAHSLASSPALRAFFLTARGNGYHAGYGTGVKRGRRERLARCS